MDTHTAKGVGQGVGVGGGDMCVGGGEGEVLKGGHIGNKVEPKYPLPGYASVFQKPRN